MFMDYFGPLFYLSLYQYHTNFLFVVYIFLKIILSILDFSLLYKFQNQLVNINSNFL